MQRLEQTNNQSVEKYYTSEAKQLKPEQSIANMVERFVQSIGQLNDSGSFDTSFEVKNIETPQRIRHRCVTELDREHLMQFVRDFEARQTLNKSSTAKCASPYLCRKAKELYQRAANSRASTPTRNNEQIYEDSPTSTSASPLQKMMKSAEAEDLMAPPTALQRAQPERNSCRSAAKVLQFFSAKKKSTKCSAADSSPVELRTQLGCQPLPQSDGEDDKHNGDDDDAENDFDDGISSASSNFKSQSSNNSSRNISPDSSFELHAPLLPTFKVTPSKTVCRAGKNAAYEFARFLRGSFHAKRATVKSLRRSLSDPDSMEHLDFTKPCALSHKARPKAVLSDTTNLMRVSHF